MGVTIINSTINHHLLSIRIHHQPMVLTIRIHHDPLHSSCRCWVSAGFILRVPGPFLRPDHQVPRYHGGTRFPTQKSMQIELVHVGYQIGYGLLLATSLGVGSHTSVIRFCSWLLSDSEGFLHGSHVYNQGTLGTPRDEIIHRIFH